MCETSSLLKFGYSSEQLELREYQELKDMIKSQENLDQMTHSKVKEDFEDLSENQEKLIDERMLDAKLRQILDPQEVQNVLLNTKLINDNYSQFSDLSKTINKLEQNMKKSFAEQRTALLNDVLQILHKSNFEI